MRFKPPNFASKLFFCGSNIFTLPSNSDGSERLSGASKSILDNSARHFLFFYSGKISKCSDTYENKKQKSLFVGHPHKQTFNFLHFGELPNPHFLFTVFFFAVSKPSFHLSAYFIPISSCQEETYAEI